MSSAVEVVDGVEFSGYGSLVEVSPAQDVFTMIAWRIRSQLYRERDMSNEGYHEPIAELTDATRDMHRAITSLMEELEAVDWYNQRVDACKDEALRSILAHNRDEEKEHAAMILEWIRRQDPAMDKELKDYLFTEKQIAHK